MAGNGNGGPDASRTLDGWKEIAAYLGVEKTTAQRWERREGLPVRHMPGKSGRVFAESAALDAWKVAKVQQPVPETRAPGAAPSRIGSALWVFAAAGVLAVCGISLSFSAFKSKDAPAGFRIEGHTFVATSSGGSELWRRAFAELRNDTSYKGPNKRPWPLFRDLDGDGRVETLLSHANPANVTESTSLFCMSERGELLWRYRPGRTVRDSLEDIPPVYWVSDIQVIPREGAAGHWIVVSSVHGWNYADQVTVLDPAGRVAGEYWHSGHLLHGAHADVDGDGKSEVLLAGVNNGYKAATLVVLDPANVHGASAEPDGDSRQIQGMGSGTEKAVVIFPRTCIGKREQYTRAIDVDSMQGVIIVHVAEGIFEPHPERPLIPYLVYRLDPSLRVVSVTVSDQFGAIHDDMYRRGLLDHRFSQAELEEMRRVRIVKKTY